MIRLSGNEGMTAKPELARIEEPGKNWSLRAFPNLFPAASSGERSHFLVEPAEAVVIINAHGAHEVIVETEVHDEDFAKIPVWKVFNLLHVSMDRMKALYADPKIFFVQIFKNFGEVAGASLDHPHCQIIALPHIPEKISERMHNCRQRKMQMGKDPFVEVIELADVHKLVIEDTDHFLCYAPYDSKMPFEMAVMPKENVARLEHSRQHFQELATLISRTFRRLENVVKELPPFNMMLEEAPPSVYLHPEEFFRWRWRVIPRLTKMAGFELATGYYINSLPPERAAEAMHKVKLS